MSRIPFPGRVSEIERQNLDAVQFKPATQTVRFEFRFNMPPKQLMILPVNGLVKGLEPVSIEESFDASIDLYIGIPGNIFAFGMYVLENQGVARSVEGLGDNLMVPVTSAIPVILSILGGGATKGSGWGLFKWTNLNLIRRV